MSWRHNKQKSIVDKKRPQQINDEYYEAIFDIFSFLFSKCILLSATF